MQEEAEYITHSYLEVFGQLLVVVMVGFLIYWIVGTYFRKKK